MKCLDKSCIDSQSDWICIGRLSYIAFCKLPGSSTKAMPHNRHGVSHYRHLNCFVQPKATKTSTLCITSPLWGIHRWLVDSPCKGTVIRDVFPCHHVIMFKGAGLSTEDVISANFTADRVSTLIQVMAWCRQATSHYLNQWGVGSLV